MAVHGRVGVRGRAGACGCGHEGAGVSRRRRGCGHVLAGVRVGVCMGVRA